MSEKIDQLVEVLSRASGWTSASELSGRLGVSTRSVRTYVTALKQSAGDLEVIHSSPEGYRLDHAAYARFTDRSRLPERTPDGPRERVAHIINRLARISSGADVHALAGLLHVSESTIENDLRRVRADARAAGADLVRSGDTVVLTGDEEALRRLISGVFRAEMERGPLEPGRLREAFGIGDLTAFREDLIELLTSRGYTVNEFGLDGVLLHTAIAVERTQAGHPRGAGGEGSGLAGDLAPIVERHFGAGLPDGELESLAALLTTRVGTRLPDAAAPDIVDPAQLAFLRGLLQQAGREFLVHLDDDAFLVRLALHVGNLVRRAKSGSATHNPLTKSIKTTYPLTYELAVFLASGIQREHGVQVNDDEIAFIALHLGAQLERQTPPVDAVTCTVVSPGYHDLADMLATRVAKAFGTDIRIDRVVSRVDPSLEELTGDVVVSSSPSIVRTDNVVLVQPFATERDLDAVRAAVSRVRRHRRRARLKDELLLYFDERLFLRNVSAPDEETMIRALGERIRALGIADQAYVDGVIERERISSTAFTDHLAVPHSMSMTAERTAIAITLNETPMQWGENRVNVVALAAFSAHDRSAFQTVFEQFVEVFSDHADVQRLLRGSDDFRSFIDELVRLIDS